MKKVLVAKNCEESDQTIPPFGKQGTNRDDNEKRLCNL